MSESNQNHGPAGYTLMRAILIVRQLESTATRAQVFTEIRAKNRLIRWVSGVYQWGGAFFVRRFLLLLYMLKCAGSVAGKLPVGARHVAVATFMNEVHTVDRTSGYFDDDFHVIRPRALNCLKPAQWGSMVRFLAAVPQMWSFLGVLARTRDFMPACRTASVLSYYMRFEAILRQARGDHVVLIVSNYSPEAVALAAATHVGGGKVVYANHAPVARNAPWLPPVLADVSLLYGEVLGETYALKSRIKTQQIFVGQPGAILPMAPVDTPKCVGIFLTALTQKPTIDRLITEIRAVYPAASILIRHHPVSLIETNLSDLQAKHVDLKITIGTPLDDDIAACDVILAGNSGVVLNALRGGRLVGYVDTLDGLPHDYVGFLETGLVAPLDAWTAQTVSELCDFYSSASWEQVMGRYDASYGKDPATHEADVKAAVQRALSC